MPIIAILQVAAPRPEMIVQLVGLIVVMITVMVLGIPLIRFFIRSQEQKLQPLPQPDDQRLERMEQAIDAIAIEVERISEGQRFMARLQSDKALPRE